MSNFKIHGALPPFPTPMVTTLNLSHNAAEAFRFVSKGWTVERLPPPNITNIGKAYQELCESLLFATKQSIPRGCRKNLCHFGTECETFIAPSSKPQWELTLSSDRFTRRPNGPWPRASRSSFLWRLIINFCETTQRQNFTIYFETSENANV